MDKFKNMKVLIFGLGLNQGGVGSAKFFARQGVRIRVTDLKGKDVLQSSINQLKDLPDIEYILGKHKYEDIDWADLIIKNPAVKPGDPYIEYALKCGKRVETDIGIFLQFVSKDQIIGVTGTKGKSTVASLIYEILSKHPQGEGFVGGGVIFAGNIGKSVLDTLESVKSDTLVVLEISSFQLESFNEIKVSPKWAAVTNIYPDHLNYYKTFEEYVMWKKVIGLYQSEKDFLFLRKDDQITNTSEFLKGIQSKIVYFSKDDLPTNFKPVLQGEHNLENIAAALAVANVFEIPQGESLKILSNFKGVEFRMQLIKEWHGIKIYNDTTATTPEASIAAIKSLGDGLIVITGGMNKNISYEKYAKILSENAKHVFFLEGDSTDLIISSLRAKRSNLPIHGPYNNLTHVLQNVRSIVKKGDIVLFSPAATSFNLFQNEFDRGRKFNEAVKRIFK